MYSKAFDCPSYMDNLLKSTLKFIVPTLICLSYLSTFIISVGYIIAEKETKMKAI